MIIFFDGDCNLCNSGMAFIRSHDKQKRLEFMALQSEPAQRLLGDMGRVTEQLDTMYFLENGVLYDRSTAAIRIARYLDWPWSALGIFAFIPRNIRDRIYMYIAKHRSQWFVQTNKR